jgi:hypothetical protein
MVEEATLPVGIHSSNESAVAEQLAKESLKANVENDPYTPLPSDTGTEPGGARRGHGPCALSFLIKVALFYYYFILFDPS